MGHLSFSLQKIYKVFHLILNLIYRIGIICNNINSNTQNVYNNIVWLFIIINISLASSCNTCEKSVRDRNSITSYLCHLRFHLECDYPNYVEFQCVKYCNKEWWCIKCCNNLFPLTQLNKTISLVCLVTILFVIQVLMKIALF